MAFDLSSGCLKSLLFAEAGDNQLWERQHRMQILSVKKITPTREGTNNNPDRYRLIVSDGDNFTQAMLATQLNYMVEDKTLDKHKVVRVDKLTCNNVQNKRLLIFLNITVLGEADRIGSPASLEIPGAAPAPANGAVGEATPTINGQATPATAVNTPAFQQQQPRSAPKALHGRADGPTTYPIEALSPYQNKWIIKARVAQKSDLRTYSNAKGDGKVFSVTFMDESGEMRATGFNHEADQWYDKLEEGKVYYVSKARINIAKKKFNNIQNEYEMMFNKDTEIMECPDQADAPQVKYSFIQLSDLENAQKDSTIDVIGIIKDVGELSSITSKTTSKQIHKRELSIVDRSEMSVRMTIWGKQAESYNVEANAVVAFKNVKVGDFGGRSLSMLSSSMMMVNPDIPEAHILRGWFDATGADSTFKSYSNAMTGSSGGGSFRRDEVRPLAEIKESQIGMGDTPEFFSCRATILHIKADNLWYPACKTESCNKKVIEGNEGWRCEKCERSWSAPEYRYIMSMSVADYSGQAWLQGFNDVGIAVFGMTADELHELQERNEAEYTATIAKATCRAYNFGCRAKQDTYNETTRVRYGITKILPLDFKVEAAALRDALKSDWAK